MVSVLNQNNLRHKIHPNFKPRFYYYPPISKWVFQSGDMSESREESDAFIYRVQAFFILNMAL